MKIKNSNLNRIGFLWSNFGLLRFYFEKLNKKCNDYRTLRPFFNWLVDLFFIYWLEKMTDDRFVTVHDERFGTVL